MSNTHQILDGHALWSAQADIASILGRQLVMERGDGSYMHATDGRRLFDGAAGLWHANIQFGEAIEDVLFAEEAK